MEISYIAPTQIEGTCYACATSEVFYQAIQRHKDMSKMITRESIYKTIINRFGLNGANTANVLNSYLKEFNESAKKVGLISYDPQFCYRMLTEDDCIKQLNLGLNRAAIASFHLDQGQWSNLAKFLKKTPDGVVTSEVLDDLNKAQVFQEEGHAVVLTGLSKTTNAYCVMNSWGSDFAMGGFFHLQKGTVKLKIYDVLTHKDEL